MYNKICYLRRAAAVIKIFTMIPQFILNTSLFNTTGFCWQKLKVKSVIFLTKKLI